MNEEKWITDMDDPDYKPETDPDFLRAVGLFIKTAERKLVEEGITSGVLSIEVGSDDEDAVTYKPLEEK